MPPAPLPPELERFLAKPRPAVVGTLTADGRPVTTPCWYEWAEGGRLVLSMETGGRRHRNLQRDPRLSLTVLGDSWYDQVSLVARAVEFRPDPEYADIDRLSMHYLGEPYEDHSYDGTTVLAEVERWQIYGDPGGAARGLM
ncbi:MAG: PPOX class F420-dependent oxidoreductase [Actinobacteria bacterium]|nr:MAG: PPOX class F420-dependent oxidoreductase [Actinomycetota bacterium]